VGVRGVATKGGRATKREGTGEVATDGVQATNGVDSGNGAAAHAPNGADTGNGTVTTNGVHAPNEEANGNGAVATNGVHATNGKANGNGGVATNGARAPKKVATSRLAPANGSAVPEAVVKLTGVSKSFGRTAVLTDVSFAVAPGELVEVTGPSGAGKTTVLRLIHGQLRPNKGQVWVQGRGLHKWWRRGLGKVRCEVAFIFQEQRLLPRLTAQENVIFALQVSDPQLPMGTIKKRALEALDSVGLTNRRRNYPDQLSAGERQRVAIARALACRPRVLLADEPLASIDADNAQVVTRLLEKAAAGGTAVIVATHQPTFKSSRLLRLPSGKVLAGRNGLHHANGSKQAPVPLWKRVLPANPRRSHVHSPKPSQNRLPLWRRSIALAANSFRLVALGGLRSWRRDLRLTSPAMGSIALLLMLCGVLALVGIAIARVAATEVSQASTVRVYLATGASTSDVSALKARLASDPRVVSVTDVSPEQALAEANNRPGLDALASLSDTNPFPASLDVQVRKVTDVAAVASEAVGDPAVDTSYPTSYDPDTYARLRRVALVVGAVGAGLVLLFALVAYAVAANSMRGIAAARRQEVTVTRLLGARGWMLRGPFVVEGLMTGALAGALAGALVGGAWLLATRFAAATYTLVLPGVGQNSVRYVLAAVIVTGILLGVLTSTLGFRRIRA
jgi:cell division transport system ATP-binding protein